VPALARWDVMRTTLASVGLMLLALPTSAWAQSAPEDPRAVTLGDGRVYIGEVVTTEPAGIRMRLPQGETVVGFHELRGVKPSSASAWRSQRDWEVLVVGPDQARIWIEQVVRSYPATSVSGDEGLSRSLGLDARRQAKACVPSDLSCAIDAASRDERLWTWVITVEPDGDGATFRAGTSTGDNTGRAAVDDLTDPEQVTAALDHLMGLENVPGRSDALSRLENVAPKRVVADAGKPPKEKKPKREKKPKKDKGPKVARTPGQGVGWDVLVPLPGYPSLKAGDMQSFGMAVGVAVPATAVWVAAAGSETQSIPEHAALSVGGYYVTTVFLNQLFGRRTLNRSGGSTAVGVSPRAGGAQVTVGGQF